MTVSRETGWLTGTRRFPGELRLPAAASIVPSQQKPVSRIDAVSRPDGGPEQAVTATTPDGVQDLFRARFDQVLNMKHGPVRLA